MRVTIMVPSYNETENIDKLLTQLTALSKSIKKHTITVLIVDDNSPDGTGEKVKAFMKTHKNVNLLSGAKKGLGAAMIRGYLHAIKTLKPDAIVTTEADFAYDIKKHLPYMLKKIEEGEDVIVGSRHVPGGFTQGWTFSRKLNHWIANTIFASLIAGVDQVHDHNGAFRAIRVKGVLDSIGLAKMHTTGFGFFFYSLYKLTTVTNKIHEFPITYKFRTAGESKVSFNPKYVRTYMRDVKEYVKLSFQIRMQSV